MSAIENNGERESKAIPSERASRFTSHALVEVRKFRQLPIFCHSAVLLDISLSGFKIEFTSEVNVSPGTRNWLIIPLSPLGIYAPTKLSVSAECRWFDENRFRIGGVFLDLTKRDEIVIEQIISTIDARQKEAAEQ